MDFDISDEQQLLRGGLRELLDGTCPIRHVREIAYNGNGQDEPLWAELAESGWPGLTSSTEVGGANLGYEELVVAAIECGRSVQSDFDMALSINYSFPDPGVDFLACMARIMAATTASTATRSSMI